MRTDLKAAFGLTAVIYGVVTCLGFVAAFTPIGWHPQALYVSSMTCLCSVIGWAASRRVRP